MSKDISVIIGKDKLDKVTTKGETRMKFHMETHKLSTP